MIDVVIPTWNGRELLRSCLAHLAAQDEPHRVIVVDNGSADGTAAWLAASHPDVRLLALPANIGFGAAVNRGIAAGDGDVVVLINNDVDADPGFLRALVAPLRERPAVGGVAGLLLAPGRATIDSFGLEADITLAAYARLAGAPLPGAVLDDAGLLGPSGGAAAYRRAALEAVSPSPPGSPADDRSTSGGAVFDEALFAYHEDADLALRLRAAGWEMAVAPEAIGVHLGGASFGVRSAWQTAVAGASRAHVLRKYGVLRSRAGGRALLVEAGVCAVDAFTGRRLDAVRGRVRGWRAARPVAGTAPIPGSALNATITLRGSVALRRAAA